MKRVFSLLLFCATILSVQAQHNYDNQGAIYSLGTNVVSIGEGGNIGGSVAPNSAALRVIGTDAGYLTFGKANDGNYQVTLGASNFGNALYFNQNQNFSFHAGGAILTLRGTNLDGGSVLVGTNSIPTGYKMAIGGKIIAEEVKVAMQSSWPDFVFYPEYALNSLYEVESFIKANGHLMHMPSATEVEADGFMLAEMDAKLLQQIEELTLHTIQQQKILDEQKNQIAKQQQEIDDLKSLMQRLNELEVKIEKLQQKN